LLSVGADGCHTLLQHAAVPDVSGSSAHQPEAVPMLAIDHLLGADEFAQVFRSDRIFRQDRVLFLWF
jgi:hypothetical protein